MVVDADRSDECSATGLGRTTSATKAASMKPIIEMERKRATCKEPHAIAIDGDTVWVSSRATKHVDIIDRAQWRKVGELRPPAMPWGMAYGRGDVFMTCGTHDMEDRQIVTYRDGAIVGEPIPCPDGTGSHLAFDGDRILLGQWYNKKVLALSSDGTVMRAYDAPHEICGLAVRGRGVYALGTDDEDTTEYFISAIDLTTGAARDVATVPFRARSLAWDGASFWTNHREADQTVRFWLPD